MLVLPIIWQRLLSAEGHTCPRCQGTGESVQQAFDRLQEALPRLGLEPTLACRALDATEFQAHPAESNRIWIAGKPMEVWLGAGVGSSHCCGACGEAACRTVESDGKRHEVIPEQLIIRAALIAAAALLANDATPDDTDSEPASTAEKQKSP